MYEECLDCTSVTSDGMWMIQSKLESRPLYYTAYTRETIAHNEYTKIIYLSICRSSADTCGRLFLHRDRSRKPLDLQLTENQLPLLHLLIIDRDRDRFYNAWATTNIWFYGPSIQLYLFRTVYQIETDKNQSTLRKPLAWHSVAEYITNITVYQTSWHMHVHMDLLNESRLEIYMITTQYTR